MAAPGPAAALRRVRIVGTGLIGTSVGLALRAAGVAVALDDPSPTAASLARDLGAGDLATPDDAAPDLVVVAAPPDVAARVVAAELAAWTEATVTDVASVKRAILDELHTLDVDLSRYVGSHPMAGRERSGAISGRKDLFQGRPWVVAAHPGSRAGAVARVAALAALVGAADTVMDAADHDAAVAAVSHVPQVAASLVAARLRDLPTEAVGLSGQGIRDVTRIAESDPVLWTQILVGNSRAVADVLDDVAADLADVVAALRGLGGDPDADAPGSRAALAALFAAGNAGHARIPGKHGTDPALLSTVTVLIPDEPGALGRLFAEIGDEGVNIEDLRMEHEVGRLVGIMELAVLPAAAEPLRAGLRVRGWTVTD